MKNKMTVPVVIIILLIFVVLVLEGQNRYKDGNIDTYEKLITIQNSKITELDNLVNDLNRKVEKAYIYSTSLNECIEVEK